MEENRNIEMRAETPSFVYRDGMTANIDDRFTKSHQNGGQMPTAGKSHQVGGQLELPEKFGVIPWKHQVYIVSKSKTLDEAYFYINKVATEGWSRALDKLLKGETDNPSVGLLICKSTDKTIVEWSLQDIQKPLGVASYQLQEVVERTIAEIENNK